MKEKKNWQTAVLAAAAGCSDFCNRGDGSYESGREKNGYAEQETESETKKTSETEQVNYEVPKPDVSEQLLTVNDYSRPGEKTDRNQVHSHSLSGQSEDNGTGES